MLQTNRKEVLGTILGQKLNNRSAKIGIVGLGYVGLPLAVGFAEAGFKVIGFDVMQSKVDMVNRGQAYGIDVSTERISAVVNKKLLEATCDQSRLSEPDAMCICVPTPLNEAKEPDLSDIVHSGEAISRYLRRGQLISLESTTYPGTTTEVLKPVLERSGLKAGDDFYLAFSPERVDPANKKFGIRNTPKLVAGVDMLSAGLVELLYSTVADTVICLSSPEVAEMSKLFENIFRSVNIALVNELAHLCDRMGISVWEVIDAASTKPFGFMPFYPGPGFGGHCIPLDPYYLAYKAREYDFHTRFIELAAEINEGMPYYAASQVLETLNKHGKTLNGAKVLVLGVAYKKDVDDLRESPALKLVEMLIKKGAVISYNDPYIPQVRVKEVIFKSVELTRESLAAADCVVIATNHSKYDVDEIVSCAKLVFDTRGMTKNIKRNNIVRLGG